jgi:hypothetical protein
VSEKSKHRQEMSRSIGEALCLIQGGTNFLKDFHLQEEEKIALEIAQDCLINVRNSLWCRMEDENESGD